MTSQPEEVLDDPVNRKKPLVVRHQPPRWSTLSSQQLAEEPLGRTGIAMSPNQDIGHVSILIHGPPENMPLPLDIHEELIQVPDASQPPLLTPESAGVEWTEFLTPLPDGLVGNHDSSLSQKFFNIPEAHREPVVQPHCVTDDFRGNPAYAVAASIGFHQPSLKSSSSS